MKHCPHRALSISTYSAWVRFHSGVPSKLPPTTSVLWVDLFPDLVAPGGTPDHGGDGMCRTVMRSSSVALCEGVVAHGVVEFMGEPGGVGEEQVELVSLVDGIVGQGPVVVEEVAVFPSSEAGVRERDADEFPSVPSRLRTSRSLPGDAVQRPARKKRRVPSPYMRRSQQMPGTPGGWQVLEYSVTPSQINPERYVRQGCHLSTSG